jgi:hypothetical protein
MSRDSAVGIVTGYRLDGRGVGIRVPVGSRIFSSPRRPDRLWGLSSLLSNGYVGFSPEIKRPGSEADHSPPTSAEVKKMWIHTSAPPYAFMAQCLIYLSTGTTLPYFYRKSENIGKEIQKGEREREREKIRTRKKFCWL